MSEVNEGDQTNMWLTPPDRAGRARPPEPRDPSEPKAEETSASARALAEGWPAYPGWVPEGSAGWAADEQSWNPAGPGGAATSTPPLGNAWPTSGQGLGQGQGQYAEPTQYAGQQQVWVPSQSPYPTAPGPVQSGPGGAPPASYPGPPPPLPRPNTPKIVGIVVGVVVLVAAAVTAGVVLSGRSSDSPGPVATAPAGSTGGTANGGTDVGRNRNPSNGSAGSGSTGGTGSSGSTTSGTGSSGATSTSGLDLTTVTISDSVTGADAADMALTLDAYFTGINGSDYSSAWSQLSPSQQAKNPLGEFTTATSGTIDHDVRLTAATPTSDGTARASVAFTSTQPGDKGVNRGETCTDWSITYLLVRGSGAGGWVISDTPSAQHSAC